MVILYNPWDGNVGYARADNGDTTLRSAFETELNNHRAPEYATFSMTDNSDLVIHPTDYEIVATNVNIDFESPTYSTGTLNAQDGWAQTALHTAGSLQVSTTLPIANAQSVNINHSSSGTIHYRRTITSSDNYKAKWILRPQSLPTGGIFFAMANSGDTVSEHAWSFNVNAAGVISFTDNGGTTTLPMTCVVGQLRHVEVQVTSAGNIQVYINNTLQHTGTVISGNGTIDRWLISSTSSITNNNAAQFDNCVQTIPSNISRKKSIKVTLSDSTIALNETTTVNVQLRQADLNNDEVVTTVNFSVASGGLVTPLAITTSATGAGSVTYKPGKHTGSVTVVATSANHVMLPSDIVNGDGQITISDPTTALEQQWIETNDVKLGNVTPEKITTVERSNLYAGLVDSCNSIVGDGDFVYTNGHSTYTSTDHLKKVNHNTQVVTTFNYSATGGRIGQLMDGLDFETGYVWMSAAGNLWKVDISTMAAVSPFNPAVLDAGGSPAAQFVVRDATNSCIWVHMLAGGTYTNHILKVNDSTGVVSASIDVTQSGTYSSISRRSAFIFGDYLYFNSSTSAARWFRIHRTTNAFTISSDTGGDYERAITADADAIWIGGDDGIMYDETFFFTGSTRSYLPASEVGTVYELQVVGDNVWAITSAPGGSTRKYLREFSKRFEWDSSLATNVPHIQVGRVIDLGINPSTTAISPNDIAVIGDYIFTCNTQRTDQAADSKSNICKVRYQ